MITAFLSDIFTSALHARKASTLVSALKAGRYDFSSEYWIGHDGALGRELLLRAWDKSGDSIPAGKLLCDLFTNKAYNSLDSFLAILAIRKKSASVRSSQNPKETHVPLAINIMAKTANSERFWNKLAVKTLPHNPTDIIFEITEHGQDFSCRDDLMAIARGKGYRFALDDFRPSMAEDWERLENFKDHLDYIKIDGGFIRSCLAVNANIKNVVQQLKEVCPHAKLIAEHVSNFHEALKLRDEGIDMVQGYQLSSYAINASPSLFGRNLY